MSKIKAHYSNLSCYKIIGNFIKDYILENTIIVCIGTDRCIGDCLGPLVGTLLKEKKFYLPVFGTISNPIHALNIDKNLDDIKLIHPNSTIIGIDACLGNSEDVGEIHARNCSIRPGKGVGKSLPHVGNSSIIGIVDYAENNIFNNNTIRLSFILDMAKVISKSLFYAYNLSTHNINRTNKNN